MKILLYYYNLDSVGGAPRVYSRIASYFAQERGDDVYILSHFGKARSFYPISDKVKIAAAFPIHAINPSRVPRTLLSPFLTPKLFYTLLKFKPDIIIVNNSPYYGVIQAFFARFALFMRKTPLVIWKHSGAFMKSSIPYRATKRLFFPLADAVVALTDGDARYTLNKKSYVIRNPIPAEFSTSPSAKPPLKREKTALFVGRLVPQKSLHHLLKAWAHSKEKLNDWKLVIVGGGELEGSLLTLSRKLNLSESVIFAGETAHVEEYYKKASFFVLSSMNEGLPVVLIEALFYGLPAIAYDCPFGPSETIQHNINGLLVKNGDISALSTAIERLALDDEFREKLAAAAPMSIEKFSLKEVAAGWDKLFSDLLPRTGA
ncbi:MAG: glycosyltransferase family 4 protein [Deferribacteraceae bacterium]|jgi:glycosyltransferase involved in cell wall biosynthesis|nr:glycosyltransferase family 4 protein [Deferribacteraceae bacterium]